MKREENIKRNKKKLILPDWLQNKPPTNIHLCQLSSHQENLELNWIVGQTRCDDFEDFLYVKIFINNKIIAHMCFNI